MKHKQKRPAFITTRSTKKYSKKILATAPFVLQQRRDRK